MFKMVVWLLSAIISCPGSLAFISYNIRCRVTGPDIVADKCQTTILNILTTYNYAIHVSLLPR